LTNSDAEGTVVHNVKKEEWQEENMRSLKEDGE
jgi:hypothetical protein